MVKSFRLNQLSAEDLCSFEVIGITDEAQTQTRADVETATVEFSRILWNTKTMEDTN